MIPTSVVLLTVVVGLLEPGKELVLLPVIVHDSVAVLIAIIVMMSVKIVGALDPI